MSNSNLPMYVQTVKGWPIQIANADGTSQKTILTAGANAGSRLESLIATNTDTAAHDIQISLLRSATTYLLCTIAIPLSAGNINSVPSVNILANTQFPGLAYDAKGNPYMDLLPGDVLQVALLTGSMASGKLLTVYGSGGDY